MTIVRRNYGKNHGYLIDGKKAMGVTTAISKGVPKPALPYWSARTVAEHVFDLDDSGLSALRAMPRASAVAALKQVPWSQRDAAADRGSLVHAANEALITGQPIDVADDLAPYVDSSLKFMNDWQPRPLLIEKVIGSYRWGYAGTFDAVVEMKGQRWLIDYKTSASGIWPETALQLAAYRNADVYVAEADVEIPMAEVHIERCAAIWVRPDGYDVIPIEAEHRQFDTFLHALSIARRTDEMSEWVGEAIYP